MEAIFEERKAELHYDNVGDNKARKQTLNNVREDATDKSIVSFATLMGKLAPENEALESIVIVEKNRFNI